MKITIKEDNPAGTFISEYKGVKKIKLMKSFHGHYFMQFTMQIELDEMYDVVEIVEEKK